MMSTGSHPKSKGKDDNKSWNKLNIYNIIYMVFEDKARKKHHGEHQ